MPSHRADRWIDGRRIDAIPIVEDEPVGRLRGDDRAELLDCPRRRRRLGDVPVQDSTRADLEDDEAVEDPETARHGRQTSQATNRVRMVPAKRGPRWACDPHPGPQPPEIRPTVRGDTVSPVSVAIVRNRFLTPSGVRLGHAHDESPQVPRNRRPSWP